MFAAYAENPLGDNPAIRIEPANFSTCSVDLTTSEVSTSSILLEAKQVRDDEIAGGTTTQRGAIRIVDMRGGGLRHCEQYVVRADGTAVHLWTSSSYWKICEARTVATEAAVAALSGNTANRIRYSAESFGGTDPCTLLSDSELRRASKDFAPSRQASELASGPNSR